MLDVIPAGGERTLEDRDDTGLHFGRGQARISPDNADHRNVDARENIYRRAEQNDRADQKQHHRENNECIRPRERKFHYPHTHSFSVSGVAARISRSVSVQLKSSSNRSAVPGTARLATLVGS